MENFSYGDVALTAFYAYLVAEVAFYFIFHFLFVPEANKRREAQPYRDYGKDRHLLILRVLRLEATLGKYNGESERQAIRTYLLSHFDPISPSPDQSSVCSEVASDQGSSGKETDSTASLPNSSDSASSDGGLSETLLCCGSDLDRWTIPEIGRDDGDVLLAWAGFGKDRKELEQWELVELEKIYHLLEEEFGLYFKPGSTNQLKARCVTFEKGNSLHRPLLVYLLVLAFQAVGSIILQCAGFCRTSSKIGVVGWYRPAKTIEAKELLPMIFFHGIAPTGFFVYLPMLLCGLFNDERACFVFTIPNISCRIGFKVWAEAQFVNGVAEVVDRHLPKDRPLSVVGHSFGSIPVTWLLVSPHFRSRIRQLVVIDPVTILLSEKDVSFNFLYKKDCNRFRIVAASELFTEHYLRRHFSYYNNELWLDSIPSSTRALLFVAEKDEIVNAPRVKSCIDFHLSIAVDNNLKSVYWENAGHGSCVANTDRWKEIKTAISAQEREILDEMV